MCNDMWLCVCVLPISLLPSDLLWLLSVRNLREVHEVYVCNQFRTITPFTIDRLSAPQPADPHPPVPC
jgi:hypothetical protein